MVDLLEVSSRLAFDLIQDILGGFSTPSPEENRPEETGGQLNSREPSHEEEEVDDEDTRMTSFQDLLGSEGMNSMSKSEKDQRVERVEGAEETEEYIPDLYVVNQDDVESYPTSFDQEDRLNEEFDEESEDDETKGDLERDPPENLSISVDDQPLPHSQPLENDAYSVNSFLSSEKDPFESDDEDAADDNEDESDEEEEEGHNDKISELRQDISGPAMLDLQSYLSQELRRSSDKDLETIQCEVMSACSEDDSLLLTPAQYAHALIPILITTLMKKVVHSTHAYYHIHPTQQLKQTPPPLLTRASSSFRKREGIVYKRASFEGTGRLTISGQSGTYTMEAPDQTKAQAASGNLAENEIKMMRLCIFDLLLLTNEEGRGGKVQEMRETRRSEFMRKLRHCTVSLSVTYNHTIKIIHYPSDNIFQQDQHQQRGSLVRRRKYQLSGDQMVRSIEKDCWFDECIWSKLHLKDHSWRNIELRNYQVSPRCFDSLSLLSNSCHVDPTHNSSLL
jgi:hypothetical protein